MTQFFAGVLIFLFLGVCPAGAEEMFILYDGEAGKEVLVEKIVKSKAEWKKILSPEAYSVTREGGTERPFTGKYNAHKEKGIYQCISCGTDLFRSEAKFDSGTGWPSFVKPVAETNVALKDDFRLFMRRTEVLCRRCDAHLGHVFDDGPLPTGKRYCINSAALRFRKKGD